MLRSPPLRLPSRSTSVAVYPLIDEHSIGYTRYTRVTSSPAAARSDTGESLAGPHIRFVVVAAIVILAIALIPFIG